MATCANCGVAIGKLEIACLHGELVVCEGCWNKLNSKLGNGNRKTPAKVSPNLIAAIWIMAAVACCLVAVIAGLTLIPPQRDTPQLSTVDIDFLDFLNLELGQVGKVHEQYTLKAVGIQKDKSVLAIPILREKYLEMHGIFPGAIQSKDHHGEPIIIRGVSTKGVVDGKILNLPGQFQVVGTESYISANHAKKTVFVIKPFPLGRKE